MTSEQIVERLREEWMTKSRSSFDCAQCGVEANLIDDVITHIDAQDAECSRLQEALAAAEAERDELRTYAHEATKAITGLTAGGSEYFGKKLGGIFTADLPFCVERIRSSHTRTHDWLTKATAERDEARALLAETRKKALEEAAAHLMQVSDAMWERCETQRPTEPWARPPAAEKEDAVTAWCFQRAADAIRSLAEEVLT